MRFYVPVLIALALLPPRPADACCVEDTSCFETGRWLNLELHNDGPLPRDGVLLFSGVTWSALCSAELSKFLKIEVRRGDQPIAGGIELADGNGWNFVWRPAVPWEPGAGYHVHAEIDNDAIGPVGGSEDPQNCPSDCPLESLLAIDADFTVGPEFSPPIPILPAPNLSLLVTKLDHTMLGITCCPGVIPGVVQTSCGDSVDWDTGCVEIYERRQMDVEIAPHAIPPELSGQLMYELRADGQPIARSIQPDNLFPSIIRNAAACLQIVALHLGNGDTLSSDLVCPTDDLAQALGVHPVNVTAELGCADPVRCGIGEFEWDLNACVPYDPLTLPPPPPVLKDASYNPPCPFADGPWLTPEQAGDPTTSTGAPDPTESASGSATAGEDPVVEHGCTCEGSSAPPSPILLLTPLLLRRRRQTVAPPRRHP